MPFFARLTALRFGNANVQNREIVTCESYESHPNQYGTEFFSTTLFFFCLSFFPYTYIYISVDSAELDAKSLLLFVLLF